MSASLMEWYGLRFGRLGSAADLVVAAPLADGDPDMEAHTDATDRLGWYFDRTAGDEKLGVVVMGTESLSIFDDRLEVLGAEVWTDSTLPTPQDKSEKSAANGYASLDSGGKVPLAELPSSITGGLAFQGFWDASANTPTLASGVGTSGYFYIVSVAGTTNLDGISDWEVNDWAVFSSGQWNKIDNTDSYKVKGSLGDASPGFLDAKVDGTSIVVVGNQLAVSQSGAAIDADGVVVDASGFSGVLSGSDTDAQTAFDTLDAHSHALDDLTDVVKVSGVALTNGSPVAVDSTTETVAKWLLQMDDGSSFAAVEVLAIQTSATTVDYTLYGGTSAFPHSVDVVNSASTLSLRVTASGAGFTATARRTTL